MKSISLLVRASAVLGVVLSVTACSDTVGVVAGPTPENALFQSYVALGNSITAGYQSGGITDSTQRESYAFLLAHAMNTRYAYAALVAPGCPPPVVNFQTQARLDDSSATACLLRDPASVTSALNNVAVPGAASLDPTSISTPSSNPLTTLILGGKTQAQRAAEANPTFVSVWIGNNDVLAAAASGLLTPVAGISPGITSETTFERNYTAMMGQFTAIPSLRGGVLIGVVQVTAAPVLFSAQVLSSPFGPAFVQGLSVASGHALVVLPSCLSGPGTLSRISFGIVSAIRSGSHPPEIGCTKNSEPLNSAVGDIFVLDTAEQTQLQTAVAGYNAFISQMATSLGWAYYDPNTTLTTLQGTGCIRTAPPDLTDPIHPFGLCVSLDGVHPTGLAHKQIVNDLMDAINTKYGTALQHVTVP